MASLSYTYGMVMSGKTARLIEEIAKEKQKNYLIMKPDIDFAHRQNKIKSRNGTEVKANIIISNGMDLYNDICYDNIHKVYIDESQFLTTRQVDQLKQLATMRNIDVNCYGIRTDFKSHLFEGSKRLFEVCDSIHEIECKCNYCPNKATHNVKIVNGMSFDDGQIVDIRDLGDEIYFPCCSKCYHQLIKTKILN